MAIILSISVSPEFDALRKQHGLSWSEASHIGMAILLSDKGVREYDNTLNLYRKMRRYQELAAQANQQLAELENKAREAGLDLSQYRKEAKEVEDDAKKEC